MTFEELNVVRTLKKRIADTKQKMAALRDCVESTTTKYTRENNYTALDISPKSRNVESRTEILTALILDAEAELNQLQARLIEEVPKLTHKIRSEVHDDLGQTLLIYRYVACKYFRDIGFLMGHSEQWVYWKHNRILKKIIVD